VAVAGVEIDGSRLLTEWLGEQKVSLALTTYQSNRLLLVGQKPTGQLAAVVRTFDRIMGLWATPDRLIFTSRHQIWQLAHGADAREPDSLHDRLYCPRLCHYTGEIDAHDLVVEDGGRIVFVNTLHSCLATVSDRLSFTTLWTPPFISRLAPEDRCHLNGVALRDGQARYVTLCSRSDVADGWRDHRRQGGCVMDVQNDTVVVEGLSMPHSPRWYQGKLWLINSGTGEFGTADLERGTFEPVAFCPGYGRGLAFIGHYALVGLSLPREKSFLGLPLDQQLAERQAAPRCGVLVINLNTGNVEHWMRIGGLISELYDVQLIAGVSYPSAIGLTGKDIRHRLVLEPEGGSIGGSDPSRSTSSAAAALTPGAQRQCIVIRKHDKGGFFSNFNKVIQVLSLAGASNDFRVDWTVTGREEAFGYGDTVGENAWDNFFAPLPHGSSDSAQPQTVIDGYLDDEITDANAHQLYLKPGFQSLRRQYHAAYQQHIHVRVDILDEVDEFHAAHMRGHVCIGVHTRQWLQRHEQFSGLTLPTQGYIQVVQQLMVQSGATKVFLATDEAETVAAMQAAFGDRLVCRAEIYRTSVLETEELHWQDQNRGSRLGREVLIDALLLARCNYLLHGISNVATAVAFINPGVELLYLYADRQGRPHICSHTVPTEFLQRVLRSRSDAPRLAADPAFSARYHAALERHKAGATAEALAAFEQLAQEFPDQGPVHYQLARIHQKQGQLTPAIAHYRQALEHLPDLAPAWFNLGVALQSEQQTAAAIAAYRQALEHQSDHLGALNNLGKLLEQTRRLKGAISCYRRAIQLSASDVRPRFNLGCLLATQTRYEAALPYLEQAAALAPDSLEILVELESVRLSLGDWKDHAQRMQQLHARLEQHFANPECEALGGVLGLNHFGVSPGLQAIAARHFAESIAASEAERKASCAFSHPSARSGKLRLGYLSPDFREHAVGMLTHALFQHHDRGRFEVFAYSLHPQCDAFTDRIRAGCDCFVDLSGQPTDVAARRIHGDGIDVLIDLAGYTMHSRSDILALQPAPVQIHWLGYPGTLGADFVPFLLADHWLIPPEAEPHYSEQVIRLPHAFVASPLEIASQSSSRSELGLPDQSIVFCAFHKGAKIDPGVFSAWMRILQQVPDGVLWLSARTKRLQANLRRAAQERGIAPERLIFAPYRPLPDFLAQCRQADLFLDTFLYGAGSTAACMLQAGVPVLTYPGPTYASRMAASVLDAAGMADLICPDPDSYVERAVRLALEPDELTALRRKLADQLAQAPLFDPPKFVRQLEEALLRIRQTIQPRLGAAGR